jgi:dihydrofolate reductase
MISLIFAIDPHGVIGRNNSLPWHYPQDLRYFRDVTRHHKVIMGKNTYLSILARNGRPLPDRENYVVSHGSIDDPRVVPVHDLRQFLEASHAEEIFVIGGKAVFEQAWPYADRLYVTHVKASHEGDVVLSCFDLSDFVRTSFRDDPDLVFAVYERKHST